MTGDYINKESLPKLTGTEKQIAWANQIRERAVDTINHNIVIWDNRRTGDKDYDIDDTIEAYKEVGNQLKKVFDQITSASQIIDKRYSITSSRILSLVDETRNRIGNRRNG